MAEVNLMSALRNLGLGLAAMAHRPVYARLSALVSLFLVTVASSVGGEAGMAVLAPVGGFAVAGTLWLMLVYWKGLGPEIGRGAGVAAAAALGRGLGAGGRRRCSPRSRRSGLRGRPRALAGLVPTSGGTDWSDPDARSGVGDGDNEVSASEHPESVGFTESEVYLETDRPSLYDAFNETYGEPFKPKKQEKMIALGQQDVGEQKERPAENLQAGREFAAVRRKPEPRPRRPGERAARALVYVKGPTPLHLPLTIVQPLRRHGLARGALLQPAFPRRAGAARLVVEAAVVGGALPRRGRRPPGQDRDARIEPDAGAAAPGPVPRRQRQPARLLRLGPVRDHPDDRSDRAGGDGHRLRGADRGPGAAEVDRVPGPAGQRGRPPPVVPGRLRDRPVGGRAGEELGRGPARRLVRRWRR